MKKKVIEKPKNIYLLIILLFIYVLNVDAQDEAEILDRETVSDTIQTTSPLEIQSFKIDTAFTNRVYKENFKLIPSKVNIYDMPYSMTANYPNYRRLTLNSGVLLGAGFVALGVLYVMPEDATAWNKKELTKTPFFQRWWNHVRTTPVMDKDSFIFNYVLHSYGGAVYYMGARSQGFNIFYSSLYSAIVSTLFWEYGIEAFMEVPSIQDLILTPLAGAAIGEGFYLLKRHIVSNGYRLFGSRFLGNVVVYIIDPVNEVVGIFAGNPNRENLKSKNYSFSCTPWLKPGANGNIFGFTANLTF